MCLVSVYKSGGLSVNYQKEKIYIYIYRCKREFFVLIISPNAMQDVDTIILQKFHIKFNITSF